MNVTIVGAGNMGLAMTAYLAANHKANVTLFTEKNVLEKGSLHLHDVENAIEKDTADFTCSADPAVALAQADITFVTYPAFLRKPFIEKYQSYFRAGALVGFIPGYGGAEYACVELVRHGVTVFGFQRTPYVARKSETEHGVIAGILSRKKELFVGTIPSSETERASAIIESLLDIPVRRVREYLSVTLTPTNPLLHISGLYNAFKDYVPGKFYPAQLKFYEEWNDATSELLFAYNEELQQICRAMQPLDLSEVVSLPIYYESPTPPDMTRKLKSIESFKAVLVPMKQEAEGFVPDLGSRMFVEDYPFGVCIIKDFARITGVETPMVDMLLDFYEKLSGHKYFNADGTYTDEIRATGVPGIYGLNTKEDIIAFYHGKIGE